MENEFMKRGYLLPDGCKDLMDVLKLKEQKHSLPALPFIATKGWSTPLVVPSPEMLKKLAKAQEGLQALALKQSSEALKKWDALKAFKTAAEKVPIKGVLTIPKKTSLFELAIMLGQKPFLIVAELMKLGFFLSSKDGVSFETASLVARKYGYLAKRGDE